MRLEISSSNMNKDIEQAITKLRLNAERYAKAERYYNGQHDLAFATEKFQNTFGTLFREFALNLCPVICDAVKDKLRVVGFSVDAVSEPPASVGGKNQSMGSTHTNGHNAVSAAASVPPAHAGGSDLIGAAARRIWQRGRLALRAGEVDKESLLCGGAYMLIWPNLRGEAVFYPNKAANITICADEASPGSIGWAAKVWRTADKHIRLKIFYPDRNE